MLKYLFYKHPRIKLYINIDPPYNTGGDFRYNDKWDEDPNDPDLGDLVPMDDGSRHTKWLRFMTPRIWMMHEMLKRGGVLAICIDYRELFRLGMLLDEIFGEQNRIGIINWQKTYSPKNQDKHISVGTEYVLVYAKEEISLASTNKLERTEEMNSRYWNPDDDEDGLWKKQGDPTAKDPSPSAIYAIQSPFTGKLYYPPRGRHWSHPKTKMNEWLQEWGVNYLQKDIKDNKGKALLIDGFDYKNPESPKNKIILNKSRKKAEKRLKNKSWPRLYFGQNGNTGPNLKRYLKDVQQGRVPLNYWANEDYSTPFFIGSQSWGYEESGHSQAGINELNSIVGRGHGFETVKPLKLIQKIIQLWCPSNGIVLDPFAGSGTTGHAVISLNKESDAARRFILIEQGREERGDPYARTLTADRINRAITGNWAKGKTYRTRSIQISMGLILNLYWIETPFMK